MPKWSGHGSVHVRDADRRERFDNPGTNGTGVTSPGLALDAAEVFWTEFAIRNQLASYELVRLFLATDVLPDAYINLSQTEDVNPRDGRPDPLALSQQLRDIAGPQDFVNSFFRSQGIAVRSLGFTNPAAADALVQRIRRGETLATVARSQGINFSTTDLVNRLIQGFSIQSVYSQMDPATRRFDIAAIDRPASLPLTRKESLGGESSTFSTPAATG